ncbi:MAG: vitamin K epoxide reductase family protein [Anaerolineales bacterium]
MRRSLGLILALLLSMLVTLSAGAQSPVVRAVLFFSPTCPHCHQVMTQDLPPLQATYGDQLHIVTIDVTNVEGQQLYRAAVAAYSIPQERLGVPTLIVGDQVMVGALEIPQLFPSIIEEGIAQGGVDWPAIPGLETAIVSIEAEPSEGSSAAGDSASTLDKLARDPVGNGLAILVLVALLVSMAFAVSRWRSPGPPSKGTPKRPFYGASAWVIGAALVGLTASTYLAWAETGANEVLCGPVGDCAAVQASRYSSLFGVPVAVLGMIGYVAVAVAIGLAHTGGARRRQQAHLTTFGLAVMGTIFSFYLTSLEPFVIGAACAWCLASALAMAVLLALSAAPARQAYDRLRSIR